MDDTWPAHLGPDQGEGYCKTKAISGWQTTDRLRFQSSLTCTSGQRTIDFTKSHSSWTLIVRNCGQNSLKSARIFLLVSGISLVYYIALIGLISNGNLINAWLWLKFLYSWICFHMVVLATLTAEFGCANQSSFKEDSSHSDSKHHIPGLLKVR